MNIKNKKKELTLEEVRHVADLANLNLTEKEVEKFREQLGETIEYIDHLSQVDTTNILPTSQVTGLENVYREDEIKPSLPREKILESAKKTKGGFFRNGS